MVRAVYTAVAFAAMPLVAVYLLWRSRKQREYRLHWAERFGLRFKRSDPGPLIWIHAVSLGETRAAEPLINALAAHYPRHRFLLTHMTPTGRAAGAEIGRRLPGRVLQSYLPYDLPYAVRRFLRAFRPLLGISVETEAWPNLVAAAVEQRIPMTLVNARLSERSFQRSRRYAALMPGLLHETAERFSLALAQTAADADRIRQVGARKVEVTGNMKFDFAPDEGQVARGNAWRRACGTRRVWVLASTREGEEAMFLEALPAQFDALVVIVPRHPQRFDEVARLIEARGIPFVRRSQSILSAFQECGILLGDSMGEMAAYYAAADVAFIGGSLLHLGGQNLIEACAVGTPVVVGLHTFNFEQATRDAIAAGAAVRVADAAQAVGAMASIASDRARRTQMSEAALKFADVHRGATARSLARLVPFIEAASAVDLTGRAASAPVTAESADR
ncbi:MAG TPA: lipid IV(A) 3-deoxy-D-manno-octulosonic acid transferase [Burkholderiaceae bacterium]|nr:lipid IV(A) 3-deoxy-D-manno-octulosonic acid transferase [Burkholderiaceae bacterium]